MLKRVISLLRSASDLFTKKWTPYGLENPKSPASYSHLPGKENVPSILAAPRDEHIKLRKTLVVGFSDRAIRELEKVIKGHVDILILKLNQRARENPEGKVEMGDWFAWTTFGISGDLVFAESFNTLEDGGGRPFVKMTHGIVEQGGLLVGLRYLGITASRTAGNLLHTVIPGGPNPL